MSRPNKKYSIVVLDTLDCGVALNTAAHLSAQLGASAQGIGGGIVYDGSGIAHSGIPIWPNVILRADEAALRRFVERARTRVAGGRLVLFDYPEQGNTTATDEHYRRELAQVEEGEIRYYGALAFGDRNPVDRLTKGLRLWHCQRPDAAKTAKAAVA